ncbi:hypothetical protein KY333_00410 [Candidatus Woesearchaeota archaeon]|nr:hypothetical protein [Candidatus Woesearchaeota archaeon]MBW2994254.1 hypothetical protein [Candidatus Woesearchaeota archaeon]
MGIFNKGLDGFIEQVSKNKPTKIEITTDIQEGGDAHYVCEYFGVFKGIYEDRKPIIAHKKYGGTLTNHAEMDEAMDQDIKKLQELDIPIFKTKGFQDDSDKTNN